MDTEATDTESNAVHRSRSHGKTAWVAPRIECVARVRDCVQGHGKTGPNPDSDPNSTTKTGVG